MRDPSFRSVSNCLGEVWGRLCIDNIRPGSEKPESPSFTFMCNVPHQAGFPMAISTSVGAGTGYGGRAHFSAALAKLHRILGPEKKIKPPDTTTFSLPGIRGARTNTGVHGSEREWQLEVTQHTDPRGRR